MNQKLHLIKHLDESELETVKIKEFDLDKPIGEILDVIDEDIVNGRCGVIKHITLSHTFLKQYEITLQNDDGELAVFVLHGKYNPVEIEVHFEILTGHEGRYGRLHRGVHWD